MVDTTNPNIDPNRVDQFNQRLGTGTDRLGFFSRAVDRAAGAFGGVIRGAPQSISEFGAGLARLAGVGGPVVKAMQFAEGYVTVWQELTQYGVNFGNQLDEMIIQAGAANMRMEQLGRVVQRSSKDFAGLGGTANQGVQQFLASQADFYRNFRDLDMSLRQLGMSTDQINERFLQFDTMSQVSGLRQRMTDRQRQEAGVRFAESVDKLAKLTGKQADELAREQLALSRQGNIYARDQELVGKATEGTTARIVTRFNQMGDEIGEFTADILTRGFADGSPVNQAMRAIAPELESMLQRIRQAQSAGNLREVERLESETVAYLARVRRDRRAQAFSQLGSATEQTQAANRIMTSMNKSAELLSDAEVRSRIATERRINAQEVTDAEVARYREQQLTNERTGQRSGQGSRAVTDLMLQTLQSLQLSASTAQERAVTTIFDNIQSAAGALRDGIASIDWQAAVNAAVSEVTGTISMLAPGRDIRTALQGMQQTLTTRASMQDTLGATGTADQLRREADRVGTIIQDLTSGRINEDEARRRAGAIESAMSGVGTVRIESRGPLTVQILGQVRNLVPETGTPTPEGGRPGNSVGTFGRTGSFFANFGPGTNVRLHGMEGVFRPNHIEDIMERSSRGTIQGLVNQLNASMGSMSSTNISEMSGSVRTIASNLDSRLNTLRANVSREIKESQAINPEMIGEQLRTALSSMPTDMRKAFEDAFGNTLRQPMEQLVSVSTRGTEYQERVYKNTRGISQDYLRGA